MLVVYMERLLLKGDYSEVKEIAEKVKEIEILHNCLEKEEANEVVKSYYLSAGISYYHFNEHIKAYKCIRYITSP